MPGNKLRYIFEDHMPRLKELMRIPTRDPVNVVIVDDNEYAVVGMRTLLGNWNNVGLMTVIQTRRKKPGVNPYTDIVLLDEDLDGMRGSDLAEELRRGGFSGIIASTSFIGGDERLQYKYHFNNKVGVGTSVDATTSFIKFMNELIAETEHGRMS